MPRLPRISGAEAVRVLGRLGFTIRQTGRHVVLKKQTDQETFGCVVPLHRELKNDSIGCINFTCDILCPVHAGGVLKFCDRHNIESPNPLN